MIWISLAVLVAFVGAAFLVEINLRHRRWQSARTQNAMPGPSHLEELVPESLFVEIDGCKVHYVQAGHGPAIVLLHGIGASIFIWRMLFPILQKKFRVIAIDLPGFGQSDKPAKRQYGLDAQTNVVEKVLAHLDVHNTTLVGSSMGGTIALWLAKQHPHRFERVVALAPAVDSTRVSAATHRLASVAPLFRHAINRMTMKRILRYVIARDERISDAVVERYLAPFQDDGSSLRSFVAATELLSDSRLPAELSEVASQVLLIHGRQDVMVSLSSIEKLAKIIPQAEISIHETSGHHIMEDEPVWLARKIEEFLLLDSRTHAER